MSICTRLRIESSLPELASGATGARGNGSQSAAQTPPGHARRGLGLRESNKLPQTIGNTLGNSIKNKSDFPDTPFEDISIVLKMFMKTG